MGRRVPDHDGRPRHQHSRADLLQRGEKAMTTNMAAVLTEKQDSQIGRRDGPEKVVQISARNFNFYYGAFHALKKINIEIFKGHVTASIGPSGCGKSTFLRCFNRMFELYPEQRAEGELLLDGRNILGKRVDATSLRAKVGMVFQKPTPFPMSIYDNIAFGVALHEKLGKGQMDERVEWALQRAALWD